jgi:hypothetical protein
VGTVICAYQSLDGTTWTAIGSDTVTQGATVYVGLAVTAHNAGEVSEAKFRDLQTERR